MANILQQIITHKRREVEASAADTPLAEIAARARDAEAPRDFLAAVTADSPHVHVIAEIKKSSPSAGLIREDFDPAAIAEAYHRAGAAAISCLTDSKYFGGSLEYMALIKSAAPLPVLRKDFIIAPYQVYEARAGQADAILLIAECLGDSELTELLGLADELDMTTLVEVHDAENLQRVQALIRVVQPGRWLLGVNNRNLRTMTTDVSHTLRIADLISDRSRLVSESGIRTHDDVQRLHQAGIQTILVGEHLLKHDNIVLALRTLIYG